MCVHAGGPEAQLYAFEHLKAQSAAAPEPVMIKEALFLAPHRTTAQIVECADTLEDANLQLVFRRHAGHRQWPALAQRRRVAPGDALSFWYSFEETNMLHASAMRWADAKRRAQRDAARAEARIQRARERRAFREKRDGRGQYRASAPRKHAKNGQFR